MSIEIVSFRAANGDAFLIRFNNGQNILIDMGMSKTYSYDIKQELIRLSKEGQKIDLLIITHIDEDHIGGAIKFLEDNKKDEIIEVAEIWHNSYKHLQFDKKKIEKVDGDTEAILQKIINQNQSTDIEDGTIDMSCKQGSSFASLIYKYKYSWNEAFFNKAIYIENKQEVCIGDLKFIFLSPTEEKLRKLSKKWEKELSNNNYDFEMSDELIFDDAFEFFMKFLQDDIYTVSDISVKKTIDFEEEALKEEKDNSITNGSSLAFIVEYEDKKLLFLGDAHEHIIFDSLIKLEKEKYDLSFDVIKMSHHGSNKNISNRLINLINCDKFLFSTDGLSHNHPDIEAISKILVKDTPNKKELFFNYNLDILEKLNDEELKTKFNYEINCQREINLL